MANLINNAGVKAGEGPRGRRRRPGGGVQSTAVIIIARINASAAWMDDTGYSQRFCYSNINVMSDGDVKRYTLAAMFALVSTFFTRLSPLLRSVRRHFQQVRRPAS